MPTVRDCSVRVGLKCIEGDLIYQGFKQTSIPPKHYNPKVSKLGLNLFLTECGFENTRDRNSKKFLLPVKEQVKIKQKANVCKRTELSYCNTPAAGRLVDHETFSSLPFSHWSSRAPQMEYSYYLLDWMAESCFERGRGCGSGEL